MPQDSTAANLLALNQKLLNAIFAADWKTYEQLCDPTITCFEPEAKGHLVSGMAFHRYYFDLGASKSAVNVTMAEPHVRVVGDVGIVSYVRLVQKLGPDGSPITAQCEETRVWQRQGDSWRHVHFHRSLP
ncbi:MAG: nuclear transport factor 2 family protein [Pirellulales bacterium]|nr:nuclear transport factor 2 family protein [Pirellulales bacterium]